MSAKFPGQSANQSGQRFLDGSVPRLIRHAESCEAAGGELQSPSAGKDQKPSRGCGGGALTVLAREARLTSLDSITNNRNTQPHNLDARPHGRGKHCGRFSIKGVDRRNGAIRYRRVNCGSWSCSFCGPRKARTMQKAIRIHAEQLNLRYFLTLTLDPSKLGEVDDKVTHLSEVFSKFRTYLKREFGECPRYIRVLEFTDKGVPHLHILIDRYIDQRWISKSWDSLGGGRVVWIERGTIRKVSHYLAKYLTKELLLSAPKGTRRITTSRSIKLCPKFKSEIDWELLKHSIWFLRMLHQDAAEKKQRNLFAIVEVQVDEDGFLCAFALPLANTYPEPAAPAG